MVSKVSSGIELPETQGKLVEVSSGVITSDFNAQAALLGDNIPSVQTPVVLKPHYQRVNLEFMKTSPDRHSIHQRRDSTGTVSSRGKKHKFHTVASETSMLNQQSNMVKFNLLPKKPLKFNQTQQHMFTDSTTN